MMDENTYTNEGRHSNVYGDPSDKVWSFYVAEAEKVDKALVHSWIGDMEGILIFSGLFSASVTAFIVESYKTLKQDSGDTTVAILSQISLQLVAISNGTNLNLSSYYPTPVSFHPSLSAICVNMLWFISLALSLTCALGAIMVKQWARDYLQIIEGRPTPRQRASMRMFLYEGIRDFKMTGLVETLPCLLHVSLFLFFVGLVIFIFPINLAIASTVLSIVTIAITVYAVITFLPMSYRNCPYKTPLSTACWHMRQQLDTIWHRTFSQNQPARGGTLAEDRIELANVLPTHYEWDATSLRWTIKSLTDDSEFEQFLEAISEYLRSRQFVADDERNYDLIHGLRWDDLGSRTVRIFDLCTIEGRLEASQRRRRAMVCMTAIRALNSDSMPWVSGLLDRTLSSLKDDNDPMIAVYATCLEATVTSRTITIIADTFPYLTLMASDGDEQLFMKISRENPIDEIVQSWANSGTRTEDDEQWRDVWTVFKRDDVLNALIRYLSQRFPTSDSNARRTAVLEILRIPEEFNTGWLLQDIEWRSEIGPDVIHEATTAINYLGNAHSGSERQRKHAVWAISSMLQLMRTVKEKREAVLADCRLKVINTLISRLIRSPHVLSEHCGIIVQTFQELLNHSGPQNGADLETQEKFVTVAREAFSHADLRLNFEFLNVLLTMFADLDHPTSIRLAVDAINSHRGLWVIGQRTETVQEIMAKLDQKMQETALGITSPVT